MSKMTQCKSCNAEIAKNAKACPQCGAKNKKPIYLRWWVWIIAIILISVIASSGGDSGNENTTPNTASNGEAVTTETQFKIGDALITDEVEITVDSVTTRTSVGTQYFGSTPSEGGIYVVVDWGYKNIGDSPLSSWDFPSVYLKDANGNRYEEDYSASSYYATEKDLDAKVLSDLNPGISVKDADVFEISEESYNAGGFSVFIDADKDFTIPIE